MKKTSQSLNVEISLAYKDWLFYWSRGVFGTAKKVGST